MVRYVRDEELIADALKQTRRGVRDVQRPTGTERAQTMDTAIQAAEDSAFAKELALELEGELGPLPGQIQTALGEAAAALEESGLARSEAATAVADASAAVADATQAIEDAGLAQAAADGAATAASDAQTVAGAAQLAADAAETAAVNAASAAAAAGSDATDALADAEAARLAAVAAKAKADDAFADAAAAAIAAGNAQTSANGKNTVWYQDAAPTGAGHKTGDTWFDTSNGNRVTQWDGDSWEATQFGTGAIATAAITNALIADATIESAKIANLDAAKITTGTLAAARIAALSISTGHLAANAVTAAKIAALTITAAEIASNAVTAVKIAADAVVAEKIQAGAVTTDKLDALAVTAEKIAAGAIIADKIKANAITTAKLAVDAIDGMTITGATMRTAPSGQRIQFDINGLRSFNASGAVTASLQSSTGGFDFSGDSNWKASNTDWGIARIRPATTTDSAQVQVLRHNVINILGVSAPIPGSPGLPAAGYLRAAGGDLSLQGDIDVRIKGQQAVRVEALNEIVLDAPKVTKQGVNVAVERLHKVSTKTSGNQAGIAATPITISGVSVSFTLDQPATLRVSGLVRAYSNNAADVLGIRFNDGGSLVADWTKQANSAAVGTVQNHDVEIVLDFAAGSHTITIAVNRAAGSGTVTVAPTATGPIQLRVEEVVLTP